MRFKSDKQRKAVMAKLSLRKFRGGGYYAEFSPYGNRMMAHGETKDQTLKNALEAIANANKSVRVAALDLGSSNTVMKGKRPESSNVKVIFRQGGHTRAGGKERAYFMSSKTYQSIPLTAHYATVSDYKKYGKVIPAKNTELYDMEMK